MILLSVGTGKECRLVSARTAGATGVDFLKTDNVCVDFTQHRSYPPGIVSQVESEAAMDIVCDDAQRGPPGYGGSVWRGREHFQNQSPKLYQDTSARSSGSASRRRLATITVMAARNMARLRDKSCVTGTKSQIILPHRKKAQQCNTVEDIEPSPRSISGATSC